MTTLDFQTPLQTISQSRRPLIILMAAFSVIVVLALIALSSGTMKSGGVTGATIALALFGGLELLFGYALWRPASLVLTTQTLTHRMIFSSKTWPWTRFASFQVYQLKATNHPGAKTTSMVGYTLANPAERGALQRLDAAVVGVDGSFGGGWSLPPEQVVDQLNAALARWRAGA